MRKIIVLYFVVLIFLCLGCSNDNSNKVEIDDSLEADYQPMLYVKNETYINMFMNTDFGFMRGDLIGIVEKKINISEVPRENYQSNILEVGTEIYEVESDDSIILVDFDGSEMLFVKSEDIERLTSILEEE